MMKSRLFAGLALLFLASVLSAIAQSQPAATAFAVVHTFSGGVTDGASPYSGLIMDSTGNFYGTTLLGGGGTSDCCGTVYRIDPSGNETVLYFFGSGTDGETPKGELVLDPAGNLYGTTTAGGTSGTGCGGHGCGTVFTLSTNGAEQILYNFTGGADGATPEGALTFGTDARLYSTTYMGGAYNWGTVFAVDTGGNESVLHDFNGAAADGGDPQAGLITIGNGTFYGLTFSGDNPACLPSLQIGCGVIYSITETGTETVLYPFNGQRSGFWPGGVLIRDSNGNLYGVDQGQGSGSPSRFGAVFKLTPSGKLAVLHQFSGGAGGAQPWAGLVRDAAGNLYGTTLNGGQRKCAQGCGIVFELTNRGKFSILHSFTGGADGANPWGLLLLDPAGNLYGTTLNGGTGAGVVFKITP